jgi:PadR family transcriptional regulator PadR
LDVQIKKGLTESLVLLIVSREDVYGYKLMQDIAQIIPLSESTLYPILRRLEAGKYLKTYSREFNGRLRKYYSITSAGRQRLGEFRAHWREAMKIINYLLEESDPIEKA